MAAIQSDIWAAPAKLNLFLHITGQREDGYHLLQTVFVFLDACDELTFEITDDGKVECLYELNGVKPEEDIVYRAAMALKNKTGTKKGVRIRLSKNLPMGGGLGGGSSDAATTLLALNRDWQCGCEISELAEIGLQLGADVPVFIYGHACWAEGVGEQIEPIEVPETWYLVLIPQINVSTAELFADSQLNRSCSPITIRDFLAGQGGNVFEPVVMAKYPIIGEAMQALNAFAKARLTGTGACVFASFETKQAAEQAWDELSKDWDGFVAKGQNRSPAHEWL